MFNDKPTISESKQERLLDLLTQIDNEVSDFYHDMEGDSTIQDTTFDRIDKRTEVFFKLLNELREEIIFA